MRIYQSHRAERLAGTALIASAIIVPQARVQFCEPFLDYGNIVRLRGLELAEPVLIGVRNLSAFNMRDLAGFHCSEESNEPVSLLMPVLSAHDTLHALRHVPKDHASARRCKISGLRLFFGT